MTCIPPHIIAATDQRNAHTDHTLNCLINAYRHHTNLHNGDTLCPRATTEIIALIETSHNDTAALLAAAIAALAKDQLQ